MGNTYCRIIATYYVVGGGAKADETLYILTQYENERPLSNVNNARSGGASLRNAVRNQMISKMASKE